MTSTAARATRAAAALAVAVLLAACGGSGEESADPEATTTTSSGPLTTTTMPTTTTPVAASAIGTRTLDLVDAGRQRALPTTVWYPARASGEEVPAASGPFPVVLFSHDLGTLPVDYQTLINGWVRDGFVVVAPSYPNTSREASAGDPGDVKNQPADASFVLGAVLDLSLTGGDLFEGVLDPDRMAAVGHGEGAATTVGLFAACCRDPRLRAGIVLAGSGATFGELYSGTAAKVLHLHGDVDDAVPIALGREAFDQNPWPKAFITLTAAGHVDPYVQPIAAPFAVVQRTTTDFLRWALLDDEEALADLRTAVAEPASAATIDDRLG